MLSHSSSDLQTTQKPKNFNFHSQISRNPCFWLFSTFLFIQVIVVFYSRNSPLSSDAHPHAQPLSPTQTVPIPATARVGDTASQPPNVDDCEHGRVYVYDLPPMLNRDLILKNCTDLEPWDWQCGIGNINGGYGKRKRELTGILPKNVATAWYQTNQFSADVIYHHRLLNYRCRTMEPESATAFYIPFYAGLAVGKYLLSDDIEKRDWHCYMMLKWVQNQTYWQKSKGSDHFLTIGRITWDFRRLGDAMKKWGSALLNLPEMENVTRFTHESAAWDTYDVSVPYPTGFHPSTESQLRQWQRYVLTRNRTSLFSYIGAARDNVKGDFRNLLMQYCRNESDVSRIVDCAVTQCYVYPYAIQDAFLSSDFCLQPAGDSKTRRSVFDCMISGSIPVFFWRETAHEQYQWFLPEDPESYSVFIDPNAVRNGSASIRGILEKYSKEEIGKMREKLVETMPKLMYARTGRGLKNVKDAFDVAVEGVMERIKEAKEWDQLVDEIDP